MATKTIAVELSVYERLSALKRENESFSRLFARLESQITSPATCERAVRDMAAFASKALAAEEAATMEKALQENRESAVWPGVDLA